MTARVLVVDDIFANVKLLEAKLAAEYFEVMTALNGPDALDLCESGQCDIVLLDVMMPGMDGFEVCKRLKANPATAHIPVVMVTALDQPTDRVRGLTCGADDFLTKPVDEIALIARVRSLARLKIVIDELRNRSLTSAALGMANPIGEILADKGEQGKILLVDDRPYSSERIMQSLAQKHQVELEVNPQDALFRIAEGSYDLVIVSLGLKDYDALRLCSQVRSLERTRQLPLLIVADLEDRARVLRGLDLGVNDYINRPIDRNELAARATTQLRRKRYADKLRESVQASIEMAAIDALTGLNNRRYFETHMASMLEYSISRQKPLVLMILDIDFFKRVNDTYGHDAGDMVLKGFAARVKESIRSADLLCRLGGEEFVVIMPDTSLETSQVIAERIRLAVEQEKFPINAAGEAIHVTVSIGLADRSQLCDPEELYKRADLALYRSKHDGRNRVSLLAA